jgi:outer membrane protein
MKENLLMGLFLVLSLAASSQAVKTTANDTQKWKFRFRVIAAVPPSASYDLSGSDVKISTSVVPEIDFTYFFTRNLAAELILATTKHTVRLDANNAKTDLGKVWLLPPTLNLQYHFPLKGVTPYIGAGINYTIFYGVKDDGASLSYKNNVGFSTQAGADIALGGKWFLNIDVKKIFLKTDVTVKGNPGAVLKGVKVDPFVFGLGIGTSF